jgi:hypothetical protein
MQNLHPFWSQTSVHRSYGSETAFEYEFQFERLAARAILRRLAKYGLEKEFEEADEIAMQQLSEMQ